MGSKDLRKRKTWQDYSGENAGKAENIFFKTFSSVFEGTDLIIEPKPKDFSDAYVSVSLPRDVISKIYTPSEPITKHGITPDYAIRNKATGKTLYVEVKRQDGWVEGKPRSAGRGNAHERSNKFFTPGLLKILRSKGGLGDSVLPFWTVFLGDITRDPCRVREITCWYDGYPHNFFMWRDTADSQVILKHFNDYFKILLDKT